MSNEKKKKKKKKKMKIIAPYIYNGYVLESVHCTQMSHTLHEQLYGPYFVIMSYQILILDNIVSA